MDSPSFRFLVQILSGWTGEITVHFRPKSRSKQSGVMKLLPYIPFYFIRFVLKLVSLKACTNISLH